MEKFMELEAVNNAPVTELDMVDYRFLTVWKLDAPLPRVYEVIYDADNYHLWWKGQSKVETIKRGNEGGIGAVKRFRTRSILPYTLVYDGIVLDIQPMKRLEGRTQGDLKGHGIWLFEELNNLTVASYHWHVQTDVAWMNKLAPLLKPVFEWNHDVVMRWGGRGLANYLGCDLITD